MTKKLKKSVILYRYGKNVSLGEYSTVIIVTPLWWSQMAAIMQSYLFQVGDQLAGKKVGLIVSSASSGISGVVADCKRLVQCRTRST